MTTSWMALILLLALVGWLLGCVWADWRREVRAAHAAARFPAASTLNTELPLAVCTGHETEAGPWPCDDPDGVDDVAPMRPYIGDPEPCPQGSWIAPDAPTVPTEVRRAGLEAMDQLGPSWFSHAESLARVPPVATERTDQHQAHIRAGTGRHALRELDRTAMS